MQDSIMVYLHPNLKANDEDPIFNLPFIPREGEEIEYNGERYFVQSIVWRIEDYPSNHPNGPRDAKSVHIWLEKYETDFTEDLSENNKECLKEMSDAIVFDEMKESYYLLSKSDDKVLSVIDQELIDDFVCRKND